MKDSSKTFNLTLAAFLFPIFALGIIMTGIFVVDHSILAQASTEMNYEIDESYFVDDSSTLAQSGGLLQPRNSADEEETTSSTETSVSCDDVYIENDLRIDFNNDKESVLKLQSFLKTYEGYDYVELNGDFDEDTLRAVQAFQTRYAEDILEPWGYQPDEATGYVYITTKQKINEIHCDERFSLTQVQQQEIREFRELVNQLRSEGYSFNTPNYLAEYYAGMNEAVPEFDEDPEPANDEVLPEEQSDENGDESTTTATTSEEDIDDRNFFQRLFGIGNNSSETDEEATSTATTVDSEEIEEEATTTATTTATTSEEDIDDRNFFQRLFGIDKDTDQDEATTTDDAELSEAGEVPTEEETDETATAATETVATSAATTSSLDNVAAGVYGGINSIFNFLLSPTFLLIVLVILILLLVATIIESDDTDQDEEETDTDPWAEYDETLKDDEEGEVVDEDMDNESDDDKNIPTPPEDKPETEASKAGDEAKAEDDKSTRN